VLIVDASADHLRIARAIAIANVPTFTRIFRVDSAHTAIWVEPPVGPTLADLGRQPTTAELDLLRESIAALHRAGGTHGSLSPSSIHVDPRRGVNIAFPVNAPTIATTDDDWTALSHLGGDLE
jgi:tRNA A-37 threonylcarbamoyl transferase component Bud32